MTDDRLARALARFDAENAQDPRTELVDGAPVPRELAYGRRMSEELGRLAPTASDALRLAARAQHLRRFEVPRSDYPADTKGYHRWRVALMQRQAALAIAILEELGWDPTTTASVGRLIQKKGLREDVEAQTLEDVACLVFLRHYFAAFAEGRDDDQLVSILRKTWAKMSARGHEAARRISLDERGSALLARALASET